MTDPYICFGIRETDTGRFSVVAVYREGNRVRRTGIRTFASQAKAEATAQQQAIEHGVPYVGLNADGTSDYAMPPKPEFPTYTDTQGGEHAEF